MYFFTNKMFTFSQNWLLYTCINHEFIDYFLKRIVSMKQTQIDKLNWLENFAKEVWKNILSRINELKRLVNSWHEFSKEELEEMRTLVLSSWIQLDTCSKKIIMNSQKRLIKKKIEKKAEETYEEFKTEIQSLLQSLLQWRTHNCVTEEKIHLIFDWLLDLKALISKKEWVSKNANIWLIYLWLLSQISKVIRESDLSWDEIRSIIKKYSIMNVIRKIDLREKYKKIRKSEMNALRSIKQSIREKDEEKTEDVFDIIDSITEDNTDETIILKARYNW